MGEGRGSQSKHHSTFLELFTYCTYSHIEGGIIGKSKNLCKELKFRMNLSMVYVLLTADPLGERSYKYLT